MFEDTLVLSRRRRDVKRRMAAVPMAFAFHALVIGTFMVGQILAVGPVPEPMFMVSFYPATPPPPPAGSDKTKGSDKGDVKKKTVRSVPLSQIDRIPEGTPKSVEAASSEIGEQRIGVDGGSEEEGNTENPMPKEHSEQIEFEPQEPMVLSGAIVAPVLLSRTAPVYPELARRIRLEGTVVVQAVIDNYGNVVDVKVLRDIGFGCGDAAIEAIRTWKYEPANRDGKRVAVYLTVSVFFTIQKT